VNLPEAQDVLFQQDGVEFWRNWLEQLLLLIQWISIETASQGKQNLRHVIRTAAVWKTP